MTRRRRGPTRKIHRQIRKARPKVSKSPRPVSVNWKAKYGLTADQGFDLLKRQGGSCKICERPLWVAKRGQPKPPRENVPCVDHKHGTTIVRGFLCGGCNSGLGMFQDKPELLERAAEYLRADPPHIKYDPRGLSQIAPLRLADQEDSAEEQEELAVEQRICKEA